MRRITRQQHALLAQGHGHTLVHAVNALVHQGVLTCWFACQTAHGFLCVRSSEGFFVRHVLRDGQGHAPQTWRAFIGHFENRHPLFWVTDVCVFCVTQLRKIIGRADHAVTLWPGVARKFNLC